jgi:carotenoid cleavage dioxygenase-like enzyme
LTLAESDHPGFPTWLSNNLEEFENVAVAWDNSSAVPEWLKGTYFKNGPARWTFENHPVFNTVIIPGKTLVAS